jgi:predicted nucleotidyltransferase
MEKPAIEKGQAIEFGLTQIDLQLLQDTFAKFPELKEAILFGSRAKKNLPQGQ